MIIQSRAGLVAVASLATSIIVLGLSADLMTSKGAPIFEKDGIWLFGGPSFFVMLFVSSCLSVVFTGLLAITSVTGDSAEIVMKTQYFLALQVLLCIFYLCSVITLFSQVTDSASSKEKDKVICAGVFGLFSGILHALVVVASKFF